MKFIETLKNIWKIEDLRTKILATLFFILIYRFGSFVVLPGIDPLALEALKSQTAGGLMSLLDMFSGGAFSNASIFALGIMPYITASIIVQLLTIAVPYFKKMTQEGESGQTRMNQITRYLTVGVLLAQAPSYLVNLRVQLSQAGGAIPESLLFRLSSIIILCAGSMFVMWLGERMTDKGIGNGISMLIMIGIIARLPSALVQEFISRLGDEGGGLFMFLVEIILLLVVIGVSVLLVQGTRKVPVQYAKRMVGNRQYGGVRQYIPLKINAANVMPIIFAQAIMMIPIVFMSYGSENVENFMRVFMDNTGFWYNFVFGLLIIVFTYFYTAMIVNPQQMSEELKRNNGFIPGIKPGKKTAEYLDTIMSRITLPGSIFLAIVAILPAFARMAHITMSFAQFFGGTSLLILVGVILDTLQQVESNLLMHHYDGLLKSGKIQGKTGSVAAY